MFNLWLISRSAASFPHLVSKFSPKWIWIPQCTYLFSNLWVKLLRFPNSSWFCRSLPYPFSNISFSGPNLLNGLLYRSHPHCLFSWALSSCMISWKAWCHGMMQCFMFYIFWLQFSDVFFSFIVVISNNICHWLWLSFQLMFSQIYSN